MSNNKRIAVIGIGNEFRGDDAVGIVVARHFNTLDPRVFVKAPVSDAAALINAMTGANAAFIIDCAHSDYDAGFIYRFNYPHDPIPEKLFPGYSTHYMKLTSALATAKELGCLPARLIIYGIVGKNLEHGEPLSPDVAAAAEKVISEIDAEIRRLLD